MMVLLLADVCSNHVFVLAYETNLDVAFISLDIGSNLRKFMTSDLTI